MRSLFFAAALAVGFVAADSHAQEMPVVDTTAPSVNSQTVRRAPEQDAMSARVRKNRPARRTYAREDSRRQLTAEYNRRARVFGRASADRWLAIQRQ
ncbi:hypothetical protein [Phyllobacterium myrsinacearum]|uniref:BA14K family protein n=1 Tax=Phyllobacterium myrsinacearum TaxID=28101 RepID=A0A839EJF5_9HYPH|nr:hypothetical protein [Phyllobacterium myrsinacearum]MBA8876637.1 hypothetical protein [Phyllobacterium myrsinacearum]